MNLITNTTETVFSIELHQDVINVAELIDKLTEKSQDILKTEWERVKKGE